MLGRVGVGADTAAPSIGGVSGGVSLLRAAFEDRMAATRRACGRAVRGALDPIGVGMAVGAVTLCIAGASAAGTFGLDIRLNEIRVDQPGTDADEYVELSGEPNAPLADVTYLVLGDGGSGGSGVVEEVVHFDGFTLGLDGLLLVGQPSLTLGVPDLETSLNLENADNLSHLLVRDFVGAMGDDLDLDDDGMLDVAPWSAILDAVATVESIDVPPTGTEWWYAAPVGPVEPGIGPMHILRCSDHGVWVIGPDDPAAGWDTPGATNPPCDGLSGCGGDLDFDGDVDADDLGLLLAAWGTDADPPDLDLNGVVDGADLGWLLAVWGACR